MFDPDANASLFHKSAPDQTTAFSQADYSVAAKGHLGRCVAAQEGLASFAGSIHSCKVSLMKP
jgi:hypothetical protein